MHSLLIIVLVVFAGCGHSEPYRDLRAAPVPGAVIVAEHETGFQVIPSRLSRIIHGTRLPETAWKLRVWPDGRVERDQIPRCEWQTIALPKLTPQQVQQLLQGAMALTTIPPVLGPVQIEDAARDHATVKLEDSTVGVTRAYGDSSENSEATEKFDAFWAMLKRAVPPPRAEPVAGCH